MKKVINITGTLVLVILMLGVGGIRLHAEDLKFDVSGPNSVPVGGQVTIKYSFNNDARLDQPDFGDFIYVGGPSRGQSSYTTIVNGKVSSETSFTYTYYLQAPDKTGTYTIPAAKATYQGKSYTCNSMTIEVHKGAQGSSSTTSTSARPSQPGTTSSEDLYLVLELDKTHPYSGEPVTASLVLYSDPKLPLSNLEFVNTPEFPGFYKEEIDQPDDIQRQNVKVGNRTYTAYTLQRVVLYPQKSGVIYIDPIQIQVQSMKKVWDSFWRTYRNQWVPVVRSSPKTKVTVKPLPKTQSVKSSGGVGTFTMRSSLEPSEIAVNEAITFKITISGAGNVKFINEVSGQMPEAFEIIGPHKEVTLNHDKKSGRISFEYTGIARETGTFTIEPFAFTYFDTKEKKYKTLRTDSYTVHVVEGDGSGNIITSGSSHNGGVIRKMGKDINYIELTTSLKSRNDFILGRFWFYQVYLGAFLLFLVVLIVRREQIRRSADIVRYKKRRAGKVVSKRLRKAQKLLKSDDIEAYYDELERALWGYLADKMNIQISELSIEGIEEEMINRGIEEDFTRDFIEIIQNCQFARYAPGGMETKMEGLFEKARVLINKLDQKL